MRVFWRSVFFVVFGAGRAAWSQPPAPAHHVTTKAVAAFPDISADPGTPAAKDPASELLDQDPYAEALATIHICENLYRRNIDDDDPYAEQMRLANPYTDELRSRARAAKAPVTTELLDIDTNPYTRR